MKKNIYYNSDYSTTQNLFFNNKNLLKYSPNCGGIKTHGFIKKSLDNKPLISVITVVYNNPYYLEETIKSVINQTYNNIEFILIDGGSTDKLTLDIIKKHEKVIDLWISEPDNGIYHAMNKGIQLASGEYIHFLNADDHYIDFNTIERIINLFINKKAQLIYGNAIMFSKKFGYGSIRHGNVNKLYFLFKGLPQQVFFYHSNLFKIYGLFEEKYKIASDFNFFLKILFAKKTYLFYFNSPLIIFNTGATSSNLNLLNKERNQIINYYFKKRHIVLFKHKFLINLFCQNEKSFKDNILLRIFEKIFKFKKIYRL